MTGLGPSDLVGEGRWQPVDYPCLLVGGVRPPETTNKNFVNRVVVGSATADPKRANNVSSATIKILVRPRPPSRADHGSILPLTPPADPNGLASFGTLAGAR